MKLTYIFFLIINFNISNLYCQKQETNLKLPTIESYCRIEVLKRIENIGEILNYQKDKSHSNDLILVFDGIYFLDEDSNSCIVKYNLAHTSNCFIYYINLKSNLVVELSRGRSGQEEFNKKGWNKFIKVEKIYYNNLSSKLKYLLFLDVLLPSDYYIFFKNSDDSLIFYNRNFSNFKLNKRIVFDTVDSKNMEVFFCHSYYYAENSFFKENVPKRGYSFKAIKRRRKVILTGQLLFNAHSFFGPKAIFK